MCMCYAATCITSVLEAMCMCYEATCIMSVLEASGDERKVCSYM
jgi:hypothetical protein